MWTGPGGLSFLQQLDRENIMGIEFAIGQASRLRTSGLMSLAAALLMVAGISTGARAEEPWLTVLKGQLGKEKGCQLEHVVQVRTVPIAGAVLREGRIRCFDGREYDFTQPTAHGKFELKACQPALC
jgi:hypothetical protein